MPFVFTRSDLEEYWPLIEQAVPALRTVEHAERVLLRLAELARKVERQ